MQENIKYGITKEDDSAHNVNKLLLKSAKKPETNGPKVILHISEVLALDIDLKTLAIYNIFKLP